MEGPSLVILAEELRGFAGRKVISASGNSKAPISRLAGKKVIELYSFGKYLNFQFKEFGFRVHFLMWGSYRLNEERPGMSPRLSLTVTGSTLNLYNTSIKFIEGSLRDLYDFRIDIMSTSWDTKHVFRLIRMYPEERVDDILMDQRIFAGVGNIIKNEVLSLCRLSPHRLVKDMSSIEVKKLIQETRRYSKLFYDLKKVFQLKKNFRIYRKQFCPYCQAPLTKQNTGKRERRSHYCAFCQA